jgi:tetratricopeptide (TPR) repeat protein
LSSTSDETPPATPPATPLDDEPPPGASQDLGSIEQAMHRLAKAPGVPIPVIPGEVIAGKYTIVRVLGRGGMGVVYLARDQRLGRDVALKLGRAIDAGGLARLEREAVLLASLTHPNVVTVYEVGEAIGRLYLAMEYVTGGTARSWLSERPRKTREIISLYAGAGDGLAAAHAAGLVHRDFKPDNILVGEDGRPRVADFGLARPSDALAAGTGDAARDGASIADARVTRAGAVAGTPAYMAPEQAAGGTVDARADQYAFCASLWEALVGTRRLPATPMASTVEAPPTTGTVGPVVAAAARAAGVPAHATAALRRGMAADPAERWPSMKALVAELRRDPAARWRRVALVAGLVVAAAAAAVIATRIVSGGPACGDGRARVASAWNPARADALGKRFADAGAAGVWATVRTRVDGVVTKLAVAHRDACERAPSSTAAIATQRTVCLASVQAQLDSAIHRFEVATPEALADAAEALGALPDVTSCSDAGLANQVAVPTDPVKRAQVDAAIPLVAQARISDEERDGLELARRALDVATTGGWAPQVAEATAALADLEATSDPASARAHYHDAIRLALESGSDVKTTWYMVDLAWFEAELSRPDEARHWLDLARAMWVRIGRPDEVGSRLLGATMVYAAAIGDGKLAVSSAREAAVLVRRAWGDDPREQTISYSNLADALMTDGQYTAAKVEIDRAIEIAIRAQGEGSPLVGQAYLRRAQIAYFLGQNDAGVADAQKGVAILEARYGRDDSRLGPWLGVLSGLLIRTGRSEEAKDVLARAIRVRATMGGSALAESQTNLAVLLLGEGDFAGATPLATGALATLEKVLGPDDPKLMIALITVAYCLREGPSHAYEAALVHNRRAVDIGARTVGESNGETVNARVELGITLLAAGKPAEAEAALAPALATIATVKDLPPTYAAEANALAERIRGKRR